MKAIQYTTYTVDVSEPQLAAIALCCRMAKELARYFLGPQRFSVVAGIA